MALPYEHNQSQLSLSTGSVERRQTMLEHLVTIFVAAKRSLACIDHIQNANNIVAFARTSVESIAVVSANNKFMRQCAFKQLALAEAVLRSLQSAEAEDREDLEVALSVPAA